MVCVLAQVSEIRIISDMEKIDKILSEIQNLKQTTQHSLHDVSHRGKRAQGEASASPTSYLNSPSARLPGLGDFLQSLGLDEACCAVCACLVTHKPQPLYGF